MEAVIKVTEKPLSDEAIKELPAANHHAAGVLGVDDSAPPKLIVDAVDEFAYRWQQGIRPTESVLTAKLAPLVLGRLWGQQMVRQFEWHWAFITFHGKNGFGTAGVISPDRSLAIYPIQFLIESLKNPQIDVTVALSFNMLSAGKTPLAKANDYFDIMKDVRRVVPRTKT